MLKWFIKRQLRKFGAAFDYDVGYMLDLVEADVAAGKALGALQSATNYRADVPLAGYFAAQIVATMHEDCGPCVQLGVRIAEKAGVAQSDLRAIIAGDLARMTPDASLGFRFAKAALARDATLDDVREELMRRWGRKGLGAVSIGMMTVRVYPAVKYALGHGQACQSVEIGGILTAAHKGTPAYAE